MGTAPCADWLENGANTPTGTATAGEIFVIIAMIAEALTTNISFCVIAYSLQTYRLKIALKFPMLAEIGSPYCGTADISGLFPIFSFQFS
ncbi:hypothetical protein [Hyphomicrobium sp.]|jgi:hypothetical protein|uniref:hypothetical protein n=1 Tax=Hyphomicrobium sp. TaxID=82 RepID=UPI002B67A2BF|nr:hypothetical protein [Hyphomicrobium sp.]HVZ04097.1 hypothetical protein [Hyphomicrobium sp.]